MSGITTHVLDTSRGRPGAGIEVQLWRGDELCRETRTDADGRARLADTIEAGTYRVVFKIGEYFEDGFFPEVAITFEVRDASQHYHVPLLVSPFGYSTYRGS
ncbi:MAG: hydroxyisourate hydrolase [Acidobacteriota bacterium]